eukprot:5019961-Karenia_brevis.AAC.1
MPRRGPGAAGSAAASPPADPPPLTPRSSYTVLRKPQPQPCPMWRKHRAPPPLRACMQACTHAYGAGPGSGHWLWPWALAHALVGPTACAQMWSN